MVPIAVIQAIEGPGNASVFRTAIRRGATPAFMVGGQDGWFLETVIGKAANAGVLDKLKATISLDTEQKTGLELGQRDRGHSGRERQAHHH